MTWWQWTAFGILWAVEIIVIVLVCQLRRGLHTLERQTIKAMLDLHETVKDARRPVRRNPVITAVGRHRTGEDEISER